MKKYFDLVNTTKHYKANLHYLFLDMKHWRQFASAFPLSWQCVKFEPGNGGSVPTERGIYVFSTRLEGFGLPVHGYIFYVGIAGDTSSANLRKRYGQYVRHQKNQDGRPSVQFMLQEWKGDLYFNFVTIPDKSIDLVKIEESFINSVAPPVNREGFVGELRGARAATFR